MPGYNHRGSPVLQRESGTSAVGGKEVCCGRRAVVAGNFYTLLLDPSTATGTRCRAGFMRSSSFVAQKTMKSRVLCVCLALAAALPPDAPTDGLLAWYALDGDATNSAADEAHGSVSPGLQRSRTGVRGGDLLLADGAGAVAVLGDLPRDATVGLWVRPNAVALAPDDPQRVR